MEKQLDFWEQEGIEELELTVSHTIIMSTG